MRNVRTLLTAVVLSAVCMFPAAAVDDRDRGAIRDVVERQLDAFRRDDVGAAYELAAPIIQQMFPDREQFMAMVRDGYKPVFRARRHDFAESRETGEGIDQVVRIEDADGVEWDAVYSFEREPDGTWKISGCRLVKARDQSV